MYVFFIPQQLKSIQLRKLSYQRISWIIYTKKILVTESFLNILMYTRRHVCVIGIIESASSHMI